MFGLVFLLLGLSSARRSSRSRSSLSRHVARAAADRLNAERAATNDENPGMLDLGNYDESKCQCYPCQAPMSPPVVTEMQNLQNKIYAQQAQLAQMTTLANQITDTLKSKTANNKKTTSRSTMTEDDFDTLEDDEDLEDEDMDLEDENRDTLSRHERRLLNDLLRSSYRRHRTHRRRHH